MEFSDFLVSSSKELYFFLFVVLFFIITSFSFLIYKRTTSKTRAVFIIFTLAEFVILSLAIYFYMTHSSHPPVVFEEMNPADSMATATENKVFAPIPLQVSAAEPVKNKHFLHQILPYIKNNEGKEYLLDAERWKKEEVVHKAITSYKKALEIFEKHEDPYGKVICYFRLGDMYRLLDQLEHANLYFHKALDGFKALDVQQGIIKSLIRIGRTGYQSSNFESSVRAYEAAAVFLKNAPMEYNVYRSGVAHGLGDVHKVLGNIEIAKKYFEEALDHFSKSNNEKGIAYVFMNFAHLDIMAGNVQQAKIHLGQSLEIMERLDYKRGIAKIFHYKGELELSVGVPDKAVFFLAKAITLFEQLEEVRGQGKAYNSLADIYFYKGHYKKAKENVERSIQLLTKIDDRINLASAYITLARIHRTLSQYKTAKKNVQFAYDIFQKLHSGYGKATALKELGRIEQLEENFSSAKDHLEDALKIFKKLNQARQTGCVYISLGHILLAQDRYDEAMIFFQKAYNIFRSSGDLIWETKAHIGMGHCELRCSNNQRAAAHFEKADRLARETSNSLDEGRAARGLGLLEYTQSHHEESRKYFEHALAIFNDMGYMRGVGKIHLIRGRLDFYCGNFENSMREHNEALKILESIGDQKLRAYCLQSIANIRLCSLETEEALKILLDCYQLIENKKYIYVKAIILREIAACYFVLGDFATSKNYIKKSISLTQDAKNISIVYAKALLQQGKLEFIAGNIEQAHTAYERALTIAKQAKHKRTEATGYFRLAQIEMHLGEYFDAESYLELVLGMYKEIGDKIGAAKALAGLGEVALLKGNFEKSSTYLHEALTIVRVNKDLLAELDILRIYTKLKKMSTNLELAFEVSQHTMKLLQKSKNKTGIAYANLNLGMLEFYLVSPEDGLAKIDTAYKFFVQSGHLLGTLSALQTKAEIAYMMSDYHLARKHYSEAMRIASKINANEQVGFIFIALGNIMSKFGEYNNAQDDFQKALNIFNKIGNKHLENQALQGIAFHRGKYFKEYDYGIDLIRKTLKYFESINDFTNQAKAFIRWGKLARYMEDYEQAIQHFKSAYELANQLNNSYLKFIALRKLGHAYLLIKDIAKAKTNYTEIEQYVHLSKNKKIIGDALKALAYYFEQTKEYAKAENYYNDALSYMHQLNRVRTQKVILNRLIALNTKRLPEYQQKLKALPEEKVRD